MANHCDFIISLGLYLSVVLLLETAIIFPKLFQLYFYGIICFINHTCLIQHKTSLEDMNEVDNHHTFKLARCHAFMTSLIHLSLYYLLR